MKRVTLNSVKKNNETSVSNVFLDTYMRDANGEFVKVYLYLLRCMGDANADVTLSDIADKLNLTEKDVVRALKYWAKTNVIETVFDKESGDLASINFLPLEATEPPVAAAKEPVADIIPVTTTEEKPAAKTGSRAYSAAKMRRLKDNEDFSQLKYVIESLLEKPLTQTDLGILSYLYDDLKLSSELIEYLVEYCVANEHRSFRYIESVALAWDEQGIKTVEEAKKSSTNRNSRISIVSKSFGIQNRNITLAEMEFINRWYDEYGFDKDMVAEACKRTILSMSKPNFSYADGILRKWRAAKIYSLTDLKTLDSGFRATITVPVSTKPLPTQPVNNRFNNFNQRTYNFEELEKKLISNK